MTDIAINYKNCVNCGKFIKTSLKNRNTICSKECNSFYCKCHTCGTYFLSDSIDSHYCSIKCRMFFSLNKKGYPYIKTTPYKIIITGDPVINNEVIALKLSNVLKLPLLITEQIKREKQLSANNVFLEIEKLKNNENNGDFFILLCNSYEYEFVSEFLSLHDIDMVINIKNRRENFRDDEIIRCDECANINSFSEPDFEGNTHCMICGCPDYKRIDTPAAINTKERNYKEILDFLKKTIPEKYEEFYIEDIKSTVNKITAFFVYN